MEFTFNSLPDSEGSLKNRHAFLDRRQMRIFERGKLAALNSNFRERIHYELDWFIALSPGRVHMDIRREPHVGSQCNEVPGNAGAIRLPNGELQVRGFDICGYFLPPIPGRVLDSTLFPVSRSRYFASKNFSESRPCCR